MRQVDLSPEAINDLRITKSYIAVEHGENLPRK